MCVCVLLCAFVFITCVRFWFFGLWVECKYGGYQTHTKFMACLHFICHMLSTSSFSTKFHGKIEKSKNHTTFEHYDNTTYPTSNVGHDCIHVRVWCVLCMCVRSFDYSFAFSLCVCETRAKAPAAKKIYFPRNFGVNKSKLNEVTLCYC